MHATPILQYLRKHGQIVDWEIAQAIDIPLAELRSALTELFERGEISRCSVTRYADGKPVEGMLCRISGTVPPKTPGRKPVANN